MSMTLVGVMGPGEGARDEDTRLAYELGGLIAQQGWVLVTGGRRIGVMDAASRGAKAARGTVVGILPGTDDEGMSAAVDIPIITGMHEARNNINVLSSRVLFFVGMNAGTASELALTLKYGRPAVLVRQHEEVVHVFAAMSSSEVAIVTDAASAVESARRILAGDTKTHTPDSFS
jgi:uncharacterized protein (TIGR00725 family)